MKIIFQKLFVYREPSKPLLDICRKLTESLWVLFVRYQLILVSLRHHSVSCFTFYKPFIILRHYVSHVITCLLSHLRGSNVISRSIQRSKVIQEVTGSKATKWVEAQQCLVFESSKVTCVRNVKCKIFWELFSSQILEVKGHQRSRLSGIWTVGMKSQRFKQWVGSKWSLNWGGGNWKYKK